MIQLIVTPHILGKLQGQIKEVCRLIAPYLLIGTREQLLVPAESSKNRADEIVSLLANVVLQPMSEKKGKRPEPTSKFVIKIVLICAMLLAIGGGVIVALLLTDPLKLGGPSLRK